MPTHSDRHIPYDREPRATRRPPRASLSMLTLAALAVIVILILVLLRS
jgi:hypothetical protein